MDSEITAKETARDNEVATTAPITRGTAAVAAAAVVDATKVDVQEGSDAEVTKLTNNKSDVCSG